MKYTFSIPNPHQHLIHIEFSFSTDSNTVNVQLPAWRPGRYELADFAKNIKTFKVNAEDGSPLNFKKITKDNWEINTNNHKKVTVRYTYYANELNAGSSYLNEHQLYVNPVNCCLYIPNRQNEVCDIHFNVPSDYSFAGSLSKVASFHYTANGFQELADSPFILSNNLKHHSFTVQNVLFHLWFQGEVKPDYKQIEEDFTKFTLKQFEVFDDFPVKEYHYLFQIAPYKAYHGVEHQKSTVLFLGPGYQFNQPIIYNEVLGVCSHELFHTWNIKNIRPKEMMPYDFAKENYSTLGYIAEGVTTYYGDLMLYRSGVFGEEMFLKLLSQQLQRHMDNFAHNTYSVAQSSFDTWLDGYTPGVPNRKLSIYSDGCLLAFALDILIMQKTANAYRLDDVLNKLYLDFGKNEKGYTEQDYKQIIEEFTNENFDWYFADFVNGSNNYSKLLTECCDYLGLKIESTPSPNYHESKWGIKVNSNNQIIAVYPNSIADKSGLSVGDKLLSINNLPTSTEINQLSNYFKESEVEIEVQKLLFNTTVKLRPTMETFYHTHKFTPVNTNGNAAYKKFSS